MKFNMAIASNEAQVFFTIVKCSEKLKSYVFLTFLMDGDTDIAFKT